VSQTPAYGFSSFGGGGGGRGTAGGRRRANVPSNFLEQYLQKNFTPTGPTTAEGYTPVSSTIMVESQAPASQDAGQPTAQTTPTSTPASTSAPASDSIEWSSAGWGQGWAKGPGGVARQLGLKGRALGEFARFVNAQTRLANEQEHGGDWGYNPEYSVENMPSWIKQLYATKGASGVSQATGVSGTGQRVVGGGSPAQSSSSSSAAAPNWEQLQTGGMVNVAPYVRDTLGLKGRELGTVMRAYNQQYRREPNQQFVNPGLLKSMGLYNPYASSNPGGKARGAGHW
jgi:hypothetical protein